ncbi:MAG: S8 family serine peptidase [Anaerolineae bacterium]|nr:S8 family serine peptidase [Anaerolineae bacterium]
MTEPRVSVHRMALIAALLILLSSVGNSGGFAQDSPSLNSGYYYADGERIPLAVSTDWIAVQFAAETPFQGSRTGISAAETVANAFAPLGDPDRATQPGLIAGYDFTLMPLDGVTASDGVLSLAEAMRADSSSIEWVNPVYRWQEFTLILTGEFIAAFPAGMPRAEVDAYNASQGVAFVRELSPDVYLLRSTPASAVDALTIANRYEEGETARFAHPNWVTIAPPFEPSVETLHPVETPYIAPAAFTPNDTYFTSQWHLHNTGQLGGFSVADADIDAPEAWDITQGASSVIIAVIDDGMELDHPDLDSKVVDPYDPIGGDFDPTPNDSIYTRKYNAHGTAVAGLAAAETNNAQGVAGVCPNCRIMPIRFAYTVDDSGALFSTAAAIIDGVNWARTHGAAIINNSYVTVPASGITDAYRNAALTGRGGLGIVIVSAVGNFYPASVYYPARTAAFIPGSVAVAGTTWCDGIKYPDPPAVDCSDIHTWGSDWGSEVGVGAPTHALIIADLTGADGYVAAGGEMDYAAGFSGTSGATPIVAGVAGLLLSANPTFTNDQIRDRLLTTADPIHPVGYDLATGWGRVNALKALNNTITNSGTTGDHRGGAITLFTNFFHAQSPLGAFADRTDPTLSCLTSSQAVSYTLWYTYTPLSNLHVSFHTFASNFDTVIGVFDSGMNLVGCSNDTVYPQALVSLDVVGGQQYWIMAGAFSSAVDTSFWLNDIASLSLHIATGITTTQHVALQGRPTPPHAQWSVPLRVIMKPTGGGAAVFDGWVGTDNSGSYMITGIPTGSYNIWVKHPHTLANLVTVNLTSDTSFEIGTLKEGDANDNNSVTIADFSILAGTFGKTSADAGYDARADFNGDSAVTIADFSLLAANFSQSGAAQP